MIGFEKGGFVHNQRNALGSNLDTLFLCEEFISGLTPRGSALPSFHSTQEHSMTRAQDEAQCILIGESLHLSLRIVTFQCYFFPQPRK